MKRIILLFFMFLLMMTTAVYANNEQYEIELSKIKAVKNAQVSVINKKMDTIKRELEILSLNTTMNEQIRSKKEAAYEDQLKQLAAKKHQIKVKYKADKKNLKKTYK